MRVIAKAARPGLVARRGALTRGRRRCHVRGGSTCRRWRCSVLTGYEDAAHEHGTRAVCADECNYRERPHVKKQDHVGSPYA
eukprot:1454483-Prymnesium_polylepis.1